MQRNIENGDTARTQEVRLFLEEVCCHLCRYHHVEKDGVRPEDIRIVTEFNLGVSDLFADIRVEVPGGEIYFVEVKYGYAGDNLVKHVLRKYRAGVGRPGTASRVVLVVDTGDYADWPDLRKRIESGLRPGLALEVWDEEHLLSMVRLRFGCEFKKISEETIIELRSAIDAAMGRHAFGQEWTGGTLQLQLLWHLSPWHIRQLRDRRRLTERSILPPGMYEKVAVIMADLLSISRVPWNATRSNGPL